MQRSSYHIKVKEHSLYVNELVPDELSNQRVVILLHDALGSVEQWRDFPEKVAVQLKRRVVLYDRPLHGLSTPVTYGSIKEQFDSERDLLYELINSLDIDDPVLLGVSDGATISLSYASTFPCSLVFAMAPHVIMEESIMQGINTWMIDRKKNEEKLKTFHHSHTTQLVDQWYRLWEKADREGWDMSESLSGIDCDVTLVQDPEDPYGSTDQLEQIKGHCQQAKIVLLDGAGHFPYVNYPDEIIRQIQLGV